MLRFRAPTIALLLVLAGSAHSGTAAARPPRGDEATLVAAKAESAPPESGSGRSGGSLPAVAATRLEAGQSPADALAAAATANPPTYLGDDRYKCVYRDANWWSYHWEGAAASWSQADAAYNHFGGQDLRNTGWVGGTSKASYRGEIGEGRIVTGNGWLRLKVKYPWRYNGDVDLLSEFSAVPVGGGFSSATIDMTFYVDLLRDDSSARLDVDSFSVTADKGVPGDFDDVSNSGFDTRKVSLTGYGETIHSAYGVDVDLTTSTQSMTNARAAFDFTDSDGHGWKTGSSQVWIYTLKPGWVMTGCGED